MCHAHLQVVREVTRQLWHIEEDGWSLLGFEYVEGGHADYTPGSPDLPTMSRLADVPAPGFELKTMPHRLRTFVDDPQELSWFAGNSLLHTEWNPHNVLITGHGALLVDWGWASLGAAWIDRHCGRSASTRPQACTAASTGPAP
ncbi:hypothetical protein JK359_35845 [Streptomyces actinomycinicus]|uniref:Aminoglycoside phosphotransferase domain-containing protein n=1 Tax=Streptomyces actinomycinicus TaxID=1695166 RepID=A0A937EPR5_9ACTN|nr:hypothetical protein [Streptomyces actinomycinicus]MBL1087273.1 hypothetical protein [Streptomyces actinomycinicus]